MGVQIIMKCSALTEPLASCLLQVMVPLLQGYQVPLERAGRKALHP